MLLSKAVVFPVVVVLCMLILQTRGGSDGDAEKTVDDVTYL